MNAHSELQVYMQALANFAAKYETNVKPADVQICFAAVERTFGTVIALARAKLLYQDMVEHDRLALPISGPHPVKIGADFSPEIPHLGVCEGRP